jgi:coiled-coil domain-containing protein 40
MVQAVINREESVKKQLMEQNTVLMKALMNTESEQRNLNMAEREVEGKIAILNKSIMLLHQKNQALRDDILNNVSQ